MQPMEARVVTSEIPDMFSLQELSHHALSA